MLGEEWTNAIETTIRSLSGLHSPVISPDALLLAASSVLERLRKAEGGGEWIVGLPTEPGRYYFALYSDGPPGYWWVGFGESREMDDGSLYHDARGDYVQKSSYPRILHMPAPALPEAPK